MGRLSLSSFNSFGDLLRMVWLIRKVRKHTMLSTRRLRKLYELCREINARGVPGDVVECGVYNGGSAAVMAYVAKRSKLRRDIWLFDSFQGLPRPTERDGAKAVVYEGKCVGEVRKVQELFGRLGIPLSQVHIIKGWFDETLPVTAISRIALLHIDADWYASVRLCLEHLYEKVQPAGFVVLDDYGYWEGCRAAVDEFAVQHGVTMNLHRIDYTGHYFQKGV